MKHIQRNLHRIRNSAWKHKKALHHMNKAIKEMEIAHIHANYANPYYEILPVSIREMKKYRAQEWFEYQMALAILKTHRVFTA